MSEIRPYTINVADEEIEKLKSRLEISRFPEKETTGDWSQGVPLAYMKNMTDYWLKKYDFKRLETRLNRYENLVTEIDGVDIHFMHIKSSNANAKPLLLTHGWPGSVVEFLKVIEGLTEPQSVGGSADDAFHLVIPSLPGFGFSGKLVAKNVISFLLRPVNPFAIKANDQRHGVKCNRPVLLPIQLNYTFS